MLGPGLVAQQDRLVGAIVLDPMRQQGPLKIALTLQGMHLQWDDRIPAPAGPAPGPFDAIQETSRIRKIQCAVAGETGEAKLNLAENTYASSLYTQSGNSFIDTKVYSLADIMKMIGWPYIDLLKIDIEGAEVDLLNHCPKELLRNIRQISVEFHDFCGLTPAYEVKNIKNLLRRYGFDCVRMSREGHQDTWFINRRKLDISDIEMAYIRYGVRNWRGAKRMATRAVLNKIKMLSNGKTPVAAART